VRPRHRNMDALGCNLNLFLHKTYLLAEFMCHLRKLISLSYKFFFYYNLVGWLVLESEIQKNWVCIKWTFVAQDIQIGMVEGQHWQNMRFDFEDCDLLALSPFVFLAIYVQKGMDVSFLMPLESLRFDF
jgi:hypothetical protein